MVSNKTIDLCSFEYTCVLTSCGRFDLLKNTLDSFFEFVDLLPKEFILIEDSADSRIYELLSGYQYEFKIIVNGRNLGQARSVDIAYQQVNTPYIFHCEDDWEFIRTGFIRESYILLNKHRNVSLVQLRGRSEHPKLSNLKALVHQNIAYFLAEKSTDKRYFSYGYNPSLRRTVDYDLVSPFAKIGGESEVSWVYKKIGFVTAHLEVPAVKHIGEERHIEDRTAPKFGYKRRVRSMINIFKRLKWAVIGLPKKSDIV